jgi:hypothetical protein
MSRRATDLSLTLLVLFGTAACAAGGPGVQGPEASNLFRSYTGVWQLDEGSSGDVPDLVATRGVAGAGGRIGGGRGGEGGVPGGFGGRGGRGGLPGPGVGGPVDPEVFRATAALARHRPASIELSLTDSVFLADYDGGVRTEVPMDGREVEVEVQGRQATARVEWKNVHPRVTWRIEGGGTVSDRFEVLPTGRLALTREITGLGEAREVRFVYSRRQAAEGR